MLSRRQEWPREHPSVFGLMDSVGSCDLQSLLLPTAFPAVPAVLARAFRVQAGGRKHSPHLQAFAIFKLEAIPPSGCYRAGPVPPEPVERGSRQILGSPKISSELPPDSLVVRQLQGSADEPGRCQRRSGAGPQRANCQKSGDSALCGESQTLLLRNVMSVLGANDPERRAKGSASRSFQCQFPGATHRWPVPTSAVVFARLFSGVARCNVRGEANFKVIGISRLCASFPCRSSLFV